MSFTVSPSGEEVCDNVTGLIWRRNSSATTILYADARTTCAAPWRIPTRIELISILDPSHNPAADPVAFPSTPTGCHWTTSFSVRSGNYAYVVFFGAPRVDTRRPSVTPELCYVRCVR